MQIHEITKRSLREGLLGNIGRGFASGLTGADIPQSQASIERDAAAAAEKLRAQGYGQPQAVPTVQDAVAKVQKNPQQQQYIKGLVAQWQQQAPKTNTSVKEQDEPISGTNPGKPSPAEYAKLQQKIAAAAGTTGTTSTTGITGKSTTTQQSSSDVNDEYKDTFLKWAANNLRTTEPSTRQTITLDALYKTDIKDELDRAMKQVVDTAGDVQKNTIAVNNFLTIAVAGVAREAQRLRSESGRGGQAAGVSTGQGGQAIMTQQELKDTLAQKGIGADQLNVVKQLAQDPAARQALLKSLGIRA